MTGEMTASASANAMLLLGLDLSTQGELKVFVLTQSLYEPFFPSPSSFSLRLWRFHTPEDGL